MTVSFRALVVLNAVILVAILVTQGVYKSRIDALEVDLPRMTTCALGPILPAIHGILLLVIVVSRHALKRKRFEEVWEGIAVVLLGVIVGLYAIALWLPFIGGPVHLT